MSLSAIDKYRPEMVRKGVSEVARSPRGFLRQYRKAGGNPSKLSPTWRRRRNNFVKRHMAQARINREKLWDPKKKQYSKRGLALIAWAYNPKRKGYRRNEGEDKGHLWALGGVALFAAWVYFKKLCNTPTSTRASAATLKPGSRTVTSSSGSRARPNVSS